MDLLVGLVWLVNSDILRDKDMVLTLARGRSVLRGKGGSHSEDELCSAELNLAQRVTRDLVKSWATLWGTVVRERN